MSSNPIPLGAFTQASAQAVLQVTGSVFNSTALLNATLTAGLMTGGRSVFLNTTANGANALTTRTATQLVTDLTNLIGFVPPVGYSWDFEIQNTGNNTVTLTAGSGVTINGTATVVTNTNRSFVCTVTGPGTITVQNVASRTT
jgi:hypothetical protein